MYAAIIAGGSGTRLWPKSRQDKPKQFQSLYSENTMLQDTIANASHEKVIKEQLPWLNPDNFVGEPVGKDTAPAVGVITTLIHRKDPDAIILVSPADHIILKEKSFRRHLEVAEQIASEGPNVVTIGIKPTSPETGYGYIQMSENRRQIDDVNVHEVISFKEKPDAKTACGTAGCSSGAPGRCSTSSGSTRLTYISCSYDTTASSANPRNPKYSIRSTMRFPAFIYVIPASIGWSDLGSWASLHEVKEPDECGNVVVGEHIGIDTHNCLIHGQPGKLVTTIGIDNLIVVDAGDALLILPRGRSQDIKKLLEELKKEGKAKYL